MEKAKRAWKRTPTQIRKVLIFILGFTVVGVGIILIPLPGPGWVIVFAGFAILATEFEFAERLRDRMIAFLKDLIEKGKQAWRKAKRR